MVISLVANLYGLLSTRDSSDTIILGRFSLARIALPHDLSGFFTIRQALHRPLSWVSFREWIQNIHVKPKGCTRRGMGSERSGILLAKIMQGRRRFIA
jgi:hypothetical protein